MEIQAVIGSSQIKEINSFVDRRRSIARKVVDSLADTELTVIGMESLLQDGDELTNSWMLIPIYVTGKNAASRKKLIVEALESKQIETRPVLTGNFLAQPAIQRITKYAIESKSFKVAQDITDNAFMVGAHHDLSDEQINFMCQSLRELALNKWH
jgi:CDP-6-deoxy-D-xylo-4-hexulose-3-dehydrase